MRLYTCPKSHNNPLNNGNKTHRHLTGKWNINASTISFSKTIRLQGKLRLRYGCALNGFSLRSPSTSALHSHLWVLSHRLPIFTDNDSSRSHLLVSNARQSKSLSTKKVGSSRHGISLKWTIAYTRKRPANSRFNKYLVSGNCYFPAGGSQCYMTAHNNLTNNGGLHRGSLVSGLRNKFGSSFNFNKSIFKKSKRQ